MGDIEGLRPIAESECSPTSWAIRKMLRRNRIQIWPARSTKLTHCCYPSSRSRSRRGSRARPSLHTSRDEHLGGHCQMWTAVFGISKLVLRQMSIWPLRKDRRIGRHLCPGGSARCRRIVWARALIRLVLQMYPSRHLLAIQIMTEIEHPRNTYNFAKSPIVFRWNTAQFPQRIAVPRICLRNRDPVVKRLAPHVYASATRWKIPLFLPARCSAQRRTEHIRTVACYWQSIPPFTVSARAYRC